MTVLADLWPYAGAACAIAATLGGLFLTPAGPAALAWLLGSRLGRWIALAAFLAVLAIVLLWRAFAAGKARERARQATETIITIQKKVASDAQVSRMSRSQRRAYVERWVRK